MSRPLSGVRVVEVAGYVFVPTAGAVLADLGAEIIKVEPLTGDPARGIQNAMTSLKSPDGLAGPNPFVELSNRGKRSITLDLASGPGREVLFRLVERADVFLTSYLENVRVKLGIDVEDIRRINPRVIYARGSGWGSYGPMRSTPAFDMVSAWSGSGLAHMLRGSDGELPAMPFGIFDVQSGNALAGAVGIALFQREVTGEATVVDVSLLNTGWWSVQADIITAPYTERPGALDRFSPANPMVNWYPTHDKRWIYFLMFYGDRWWKEFCEVVGRPDLLTDARFLDSALRAQNNVECAAILEQTFRERPLAEWKERLSNFSGAWGPAVTPGEVHEHPQAEPNGYLAEHVTNNGFRFKLVSPPMQFGGEPTAPQGPAPETGQQSEEILLELGYSWPDIAQFHAEGTTGVR